MIDILIIEDNEQLQKYLCDCLRTFDYMPHVLVDYGDLLNTLNRIKPKLILLDINLPKFDGFYYLKQIQKITSVPIIMISARNDESEQIRSIEGGAYDYITKPFSIGVLMAKINALLSRNTSNDEYLQVGDLILSKTCMTLGFNAKILKLSKNEYKILNLLLERPSHCFSRDEILEALWDDASFVDDNTLTVNMTRVKKKLNLLGLKQVILTKRGMGYAFVMENS